MSVARIGVTGLTLFCALYSGTALCVDLDDQGDLERYQRRYSPEVFEYCLDAHPFDPWLRQCLKSQQDHRRNILSYALDQLGKYEDALAIYQECLDYYKGYSIWRAGQCVGTLLNLQHRLDDRIAERIIFERCDRKWRRHGHRAIHNCAMNSANYYRYHGEFRDL